MLDEILKVLPDEIKNQMSNLDNVTEIRLRCGYNCTFRSGIKEITTDHLVSKEEILSILRKVSDNSIYAVQKNINQGFLTVKGGHRIGIVGEVVVDNGKIINIKNISSLNIRIASEIKGVAEELSIVLLKNKIFESTLIVSPPGCGKTTLLRDFIRILSNYKYNIGLIDERGEVASMYDGKPSLDIGKRTDVLTYCSKPDGINMLVRSMSPDIIATDEIGSKEDIKAIKKASISGVKLLLTMHGENLEDINSNNQIKELLDNGKIQNIVVLDYKDGKPGNIRKIYTDLGKVQYSKKLFEGVI